MKGNSGSFKNKVREPCSLILRYRLMLNFLWSLSIPCIRLHTSRNSDLCEFKANSMIRAIFSDFLIKDLKNVAQELDSAGSWYCFYGQPTRRFRNHAGLI